MAYKDPPKEYQFKKGQVANPGGKPVGARNRLQGDFMNALADDFAKFGKKAIIQMRQKKPNEYIRAIASLMPKEFEISKPMEEITDEQLDAAVHTIRAILNAQSSGDGTQYSEEFQSPEGL
ncbi:MAG: hypothetical protein KGI54_14165 [Pseudomonadota bacterium]|nr:hypothetical protein [Pseudomonadota bacterium]